jgi:hypothetical protein
MKSSRNQYVKDSKLDHNVHYDVNISIKWPLNYGYIQCDFCFLR